MAYCLTGINSQDWYFSAMSVKSTWVALSLFLTLTIAGCSSKMFVVDTASSSVYEFKDDYYVRAVDSTMELHYNLWSNRASIWMTAYNLSRDAIFMITDSCYISYDNDKYYYDLSIEGEEYISQINKIPDLEDFKLGEFYPVASTGWKSFLGPLLPLNVTELEAIDPAKTFTVEDSPLVFTSQICWFAKSGAFAPKCVRDTMWIESVTPADASLIRSLENDRDFKKADKFYVSNNTWSEY